MKRSTCVSNFPIYRRSLRPSSVNRKNFCKIRVWRSLQDEVEGHGRLKTALFYRWNKRCSRITMFERRSLWWPYRLTTISAAQPQAMKRPSDVERVTMVNAVQNWQANVRGKQDATDAAALASDRTNIRASPVRYPVWIRSIRYPCPRHQHHRHYHYNHLYPSYDP